VTFLFNLDAYFSTGINKKKGPWAQAPMLEDWRLKTCLLVAGSPFGFRDDLVSWGDHFSETN
jgi:hypothetical protein